jgi:hypothetical protein
MIAGLVCIVLLASFSQFIDYCRAILWSAAEVELSDHVCEVTGIENDVIVADDFKRFLELVRLCPEHATDRRQIRAIGCYYDLLQMGEGTFGKFSPASCYRAQQERQRCSHFAAVILDRSISSSRDLFTQQAADAL